MTTKTRRSSTARRTPEERRAQAEALHEQLTAQVATLAESENWKAWLRFAGLVRRRSFSNQMLILAQGGTYCLGYRQWEGLGRHVVKGAKSIKIFGYSTKRIVEVDETTGEESTSSRVIYPLLSVFDVSDTEGEPLPEQPAVYLERTTAENRTSKNAEFVENVARIQVRKSVEAIVERSVVIRSLVEKSEIGLVGAYYDVETGEVRFYDATYMCGEIKHFYLDVPDRHSMLPR